ncbi:MAG: HigA family addiction module antitoxin [Gemmatimonadota bacterium]|jgi:addiction module HigA family antidote
MAKKLDPIHPGEVLIEEFLGPLGISQYRLAHAISVPPRRINEIVHGNRAISADTALRLSRFFGTSAQFWLNLQARYDLETERDRLGTRLKSEVEVFAEAS